MKKNVMKVAAAVLVFSAFFSTAAFAQGWQKVDDKWYYWQEDDTVAKNMWIPSEDGSTRYWVKNDGSMAKKEWVPEDETWHYVDANGEEVKDQMIDLDSKTKHYYLDENGIMLTNSWKEVEGQWYYFKADGSAVTRQWYNIDGDDYYFTSSGKMAYDALVPGGHVGPDGKKTK
jgi:mannosyl-glycoprotein endo-beta-N-acetylglucosaminidase